MDKIPSYVLNDVLKFERKIYSLFGLNLGRSIQFKSLIYFAVAIVTMVVLGYLPILGFFFGAIPLVYRIAIAAVIAYLLTDVGTENRAPIKFFQSFIQYHWKAIRQETYYRGKIMPKQKPLRFSKYTTVSYEKPYYLREPEVVETPLPPPMRFNGLTYR